MLAAPGENSKGVVEAVEGDVAFEAAEVGDTSEAALQVAHNWYKLEIKLIAKRVLTVLG